MGSPNARQVMGTAGSACTLEFAGTQVLESSGCAELKKFMNLKKLSELLSASTFASKGREMKHLDPMNLWGLNPYWGRLLTGDIYLARKCLREISVNHGSS